MKLIPFLLLFFCTVIGCATATPTVTEGLTLHNGPSVAAKLTGAHIDGIFKTIAHVEVNDGGRRYPPLRIALLLKLPSLMKIESIPIIGPPDFFLLATHDTFKVFVPEKQRFYQGQATRENFARFFPLNLSPEEIVHILMGLPPGAAGKNLTFRETAAAGGIQSVDVLSPEGQKILTLRIDVTNLRLAGMDILTSYGNILYTISYNEYFKAGGSWLPQRITIFAPGTDSTVAISYSDMELSQEKDETLFELPLPPGIGLTILKPEGAATEK